MRDVAWRGDLLSTQFMSRLHRSKAVQYGFAIAITATALTVKLLLIPFVTLDGPFLLFFGSVMASAAYGGFGPGLLATCLAAICSNYFFMPPFGHLALASPDLQLRLWIFIVESVFISVICARLRAAHQRVEKSAAEARELERRILEISDAEQRRIGHDLHDGLGQQLTGIGLMTRRLEQRLTAAKSSDSVEAQKLAELAKEAVSWTHDLCRTLSPPALESAGLAEALRELAANVESIFRIECTFEQQGPVPRADLSTGVHLYRIAQEAISNAVRHGKATHVRLRLETSAGGLSMQIIDDGAGIHAAGIETESASSDGMGLRIMRYRGRMIGASIEVRHHEGGGTVVTCSYRPADDASRRNDEHD